jgi:hypothetical protein
MRIFFALLAALLLLEAPALAASLNFSEPIEGIACTSLATAEEMIDYQVSHPIPKPTSLEDIDTALIGFNEQGPLRCELLAPTLLIRPHLENYFKSANGKMFEVYSFEMSKGRLYTWWLSTVPFA